MPSRRRPKSPPSSSSTSGQPQTDVERFAAAVEESARADRAAKAKAEQERVDAALRAERAAAHAAALATARRELEKAVEGVRHAKQVGRGRAEADDAWKVSKARVIELETGAPPAWAPKPPPVAPDADSSGVDGEPEAGVPADD